MNCNLNDRAQALWPENVSMQTKWIKAIEVLRTQTANGWLLDTQIQKRSVQGE